MSESTPLKTHICIEHGYSACPDCAVDFSAKEAELAAAIKERDKWRTCAVELAIKSRAVIDADERAVAELKSVGLMDAEMPEVTKELAKALAAFEKLNRK